MKSLLSQYDDPASIYDLAGVRATRRAQPEAHLLDLFVLLHGMLFTNIQLYDFQPTLARQGAEEREWIMMAIVNVCAVLEYGKPTGVLKKAGGVMRVVTAKRAAANADGKDEDKMDVDKDNAPQQESPAMSEAEPNVQAVPASFRFALQLTFAMLSHVLRCPTRKSSPFARSTLNPYLTVILTFLATVLKHPQTLDAMERSVPWDDLAAFFARIPHDKPRPHGGALESRGTLGDAHDRVRAIAA
ncbi:hypothetical protein C8R45DRAFT_1160587 [Mycena sanguinolenta]|nr:hypothetical protein C8R45DRAFT_1160587 [Mycena sanguinolenta]